METNRESNLSRQLTFPLSGLTTGMQYEVFVRAHTSAGEGAPSPRVHVEVSARGKNAMLILLHFTMRGWKLMC